MNLPMPPCRGICATVVLSACASSGDVPAAVGAPSPVAHEVPSAPSTGSKAPEPTTSRVSDQRLFGDPAPARGRRPRQHAAPRSAAVQNAEKEEAQLLEHRFVEPIADTPELTASSREVVADNRDAISHCMADAHRRGERATGRMEVRVSLNAKGRVLAAKMRNREHARTLLGQCVLRRVRGWRFPPPGKRATLVLPFIVEAAL